MKHDLYDRAKSIVVKHTEVGDDMLLKSHREDCVDARCLLVCALGRYGLTDTEIAELMELTRPCVCKLRMSFDDRRRKRMFSILWRQISNELETE